MSNSAIPLSAAPVAFRMPLQCLPALAISREKTAGTAEHLIAPSPPMATFADSVLLGQYKVDC